jgi:autotransporter-associated beta strand protein
MKRSSQWRALALAALLVVPFAGFFADAQAATRTWTGATSVLWSAPGNWGGVAPVAGDDLVFPDGTPNTANVNDYPAGTSFSSITVTGEHQITGNAITLTGATPLAFSTPADATITFNPAVTLTNASATITAIQAAGIAVYVNLGPVTIGGGSLTVDVQGNLSQVFFTGPIGEASTASLVKLGNGEALLAANNTYSGQTIVNAGYVGVGANGALGVGTNIAANGTVVNSGGTLYLYNGAQVANERLVLNGPGQSGNGSLQTRSGNTRWGGDIVVADNTLGLNAGGISLAIDGKITGSGSFRFGRSPVTISNPANDYAGGTVVGVPSGGVSVLVLGASGVIPDGSFVQVLGGVDSTLDVNGQTEVIGSLSGTGNVDVHGGTLITGNDNTSNTFSGTFVGAGTISKTGSGTWSVDGVSSAYTGTLNVLAGTVLVNGLQSGSVHPAGGGILGGTGTVGDIVTTNGGGGIVAPGDASPGRLTASSLALAPGNTLRVKLNGTAAGSQYDQLAVAGSVAIQGTLEATVGFVPATGSVFRIVDVTGGSPVTGTFAGLPEGTVFTVGTTQLQISYVGGTGNDVTLTVVPAGPPAPSITTTSPLLNGQVGVAYLMAIVGTGGSPPYTWSVTSGTLPGGLTLNSSTGVISGTPTASGTFNFTVTLTDNASQTASRPFAVTIAPASLAVTTASLGGGTVGTAYAGMLAASGGTPPYTWSITSGALPPGVTLNAATGALTGSPTAPGTYAFTATVTDSAAATASAPLSIVVNAVGATQPIPALGPWALALLAMLTALGGFLATRRRA